MIWSVLGLGFLIGLQHALEADHVAAVSSLVSRRTGIRAISQHGIAWGIGHTLTLLVVAGTCIALKTSIPEATAEKLEFAVGVMLVGLGAHVLWRLWRERVHFGGHRHADGTYHAHVHSHREDPAPHAQSSHEHEHQKAMRWRTMLVGTVHGMAGSAALVVLAASSIDSPWVGFAYILLFGIGSIFGMAVLSAVIALPLTWTAQSLSAGNRVLQGVIGVATIVIGLMVMRETGLSVLG